CGGRSHGCSACRPSLSLALVEGQCGRLLRDVRMLGGGVHAELAAQHLAPERGLGQHAVDRLLDHALRVLGDHGAVGHELLVAHVARVAEVVLLISLAPGDLDLRGVDDDDIVARVHVRREHGLVLAADDPGDLGGEASEDHAVGIDDEPALLDVARRGGVRFHCGARRSGSCASPVRHATRVSAATEGIFRQTRKVYKHLRAVNVTGSALRSRRGYGFASSATNASQWPFGLIARRVMFASPSGARSAATLQLVSLGKSVYSLVPLAVIAMPFAVQTTNAAPAGNCAIGAVCGACAPSSQRRSRLRPPPTARWTNDTLSVAIGDSDRSMSCATVSAWSVR